MPIRLVASRSGGSNSCSGSMRANGSATRLGSAVLGDIWQLETAQDAAGTERAAGEPGARFARLEAELGAGPYFAGSRFHLVDAVFAPAFRYFDVFDELADLGVFDALPRVRAWRAALAVRPSVRAAVSAEYSDRLRAFLVAKNAYLWTHRSRGSGAAGGS